MILSINAVREICGRCPLVMSEDLLRDLVQYKKYKERSVMMAAHSLIHLYRQHQPELLHKRDRVSALHRTLNFGNSEGAIYGSG